MNSQRAAELNPWHKIIWSDTEVCPGGEYRETQIIHEGYDGKRCLVHARGASDGQTIIVTSQYLNLLGIDEFYPLHMNISHDNGKTWSGFQPEDSFIYDAGDGIRRCTCDMSPFFHKHTGKFLVTGGECWYNKDDGKLFKGHKPFAVPYSVFDESTGHFGPVQYLRTDNETEFWSGSAGSTQIFEDENGDLLIPVHCSRMKTEGQLKNPSVVRLLRCSFDGNKLTLKSYSDPVRGAFNHGIGEASVVLWHGKTYLTIRDPYHAYTASSPDGIHFTPVRTWNWPDGEQLPSYCTQQHWMRLGDSLYLVYTRMGLGNDHVFRHRAPLVTAKVDPDLAIVYPETEFRLVPERGARLGNFSVFNISGDEAIAVAAEWMQPTRCEDFGSDNAIWFTRMKAPAKIN